MRASEKPILNFLSCTEANFLIPIYQRNYDWKIKHCEQLFNDLISVVKRNYVTHFLGSIVSIYSTTGIDKEYLIIDGQQRLTTITLLLLSIVNYIKNNGACDNVNPEQITEHYLINKFSKTDDKKIRLRPIKNDNLALAKLFNNRQEDFIVNSNITRNYKYFYERLALNEISIDELYRAIQRLMIVDIELINGDDNPQLIFESLNSTGLALTQSDLVRNFILMQEDTNTQNRYYNDYWEKIEQNTNLETDNFIRDYLTYKTQAIPPKQNEVYIAFKKYWQDLEYQQIDKEDFLKEILKFSKYYNQIVNLKHPNYKINELFQIINNLKITVSYPFLLELLSDVDNNLINNDDLIEILEIITVFIFRRNICNVSSNSLNKMFPTFARDIKKQKDYKEKYVDIFKYIITSKERGLRFPNDNEFKNELKKKELYKMQNNIKSYYFNLMENWNNNERTETDNLTQEHIMPQTLTKAWKDDLGSNAEEIHKTYLHTIGNLTLTGYNSKYSNLSFIEKRDTENGFRGSRLFLNQSLKNIEKWDKDAIETRADILVERALKIWKYPEVNYKLKNKDFENKYSFADDLDISGDKIYQFELMGSTYKVVSWKEFFTKILLILFDLDPIILTTFAQIGQTNRITIGKGNSKKSEKLINDIYVDTNLSVSSIINITKQVLEKYQIDENELDIYIRPKELKED